MSDDKVVDALERLAAVITPVIDAMVDLFQSLAETINKAIDAIIAFADWLTSVPVEKSQPAWSRFTESTFRSRRK